MVIDNDQIALRIFKEVLELNGHDCTTYIDGEEGIRSYEKTSYDMVIMENDMPTHSGIEILRNLKEQNPEAKVILCSSQSNDSLKTEAKANGAFKYFDKPINSWKLLQLLGAGKDNENWSN